MGNINIVQIKLILTCLFYGQKLPPDTGKKWGNIRYKKQKGGYKIFLLPNLDDQNLRRINCEIPTRI